MTKAKETGHDPFAGRVKEKRPFCGVVMPISAIDGCPASHWSDVKAILYDAIEGAGLEPRLVSEADNIGIIQKEIVQNLYEDPIIVCDVSGRNPNVMFELGMRLAFDKPTVIVKDDQTDYTFDTASIQHVTYPRDLRFPLMVVFKAALIKKIQATLAAAESDKEFSPFLKHFGTFRVAKLESKEVSRDEYILKQIDQLTVAVKSLSVERTRQADRLSPRMALDWSLEKQLAHKILTEAWHVGHKGAEGWNDDYLMVVFDMHTKDCEESSRAKLLDVVLEHRDAMLLKMGLTKRRSEHP